MTEFRKKIRVFYQTLIESIINYGISTWGGTYDTTIDPLKKVQNKILKIILKKDSRYHTKYLYNDMNVLPIKKLFYKPSVIYIIKNNLTFKTEHGHNTRQIYIKVPTMHIKLTQSTYLYIGPKIFNILPIEIKHSNSFKILKKIITLWLLQEQNI